MDGGVGGVIMAAVCAASLLRHPCGMEPCGYGGGGVKVGEGLCLNDYKVER